MKKNDSEDIFILTDKMKSFRNPNFVANLFKLKTYTKYNRLLNTNSSRSLILNFHEYFSTE